MARHTHDTQHQHTERHCDSKTESAQWADSEQIDIAFFMNILKAFYSCPWGFPDSIFPKKMQFCLNINIVSTLRAEYC